LKLNGTYILVYDDDIIPGGKVYTVKKNTEALVVASKKTRPDVNADKIKHMIMSRDQNAGRSHNIKIHLSSFERVEQVEYLGKTLTNKNFIQEEIESRVKSGNACYQSVQRL
jgi:hypothetical protein